VGSAFLFANSAAILTDAFPPDKRGLAMGMNQIGMLAGTFGGLLLGGLLAAVDWRAVFLMSVPFGLFGTVWAYLMLHETATIRAHQQLDIPGNVLFAVGLTLVLVGFTYAIQPYGGASMGWGNPWVIGELAGGLVLLAVFVAVERRVSDPMFRLELFRIRMFAAGNIAGFLSSLARGGLQLILIVWLQGIWLPLHGYSFEQAPLWAALYMLPMTAGFLIAGPLSGALSDRYGARYFSTGGMLITAAAFVGFLALPADFDYVPFALLLLMLGIGMGAFASPNTASIMNSVPPEHRGASSGMRATFQNVASSLSLTLIFTLVVAGLSANLPRAMYGRLTAAGIPSGVASQISGIPRSARSSPHSSATTRCRALSRRRCWRVFRAPRARRSSRTRSSRNCWPDRSTTGCRSRSRSASCCRSAPPPRRGCEDAGTSTTTRWARRRQPRNWPPRRWARRRNLKARLLCRGPNGADLTADGLLSAGQIHVPARAPWRPICSSLFRQVAALLPRLHWKRLFRRFTHGRNPFGWRHGLEFGPRSWQTRRIRLLRPQAASGAGGPFASEPDSVGASRSPRGSWPRFSPSRSTARWYPRRGRSTSRT